MQQELNDFYRYHQEVMVGGVLTRYYDSDLDSTPGRYNPNPSSKPIVVALHGVATSSYLFRNLIAEFDSSVRLVVPDLPGFGRSSKQLPWGAKYKHYLEWLEGFIRSVLPYSSQPVKAHFIGHDFGALLAMAWAVEHPHEVASLFCMNTCVHFENISPTPYTGLSLAPVLGRSIGRVLAREPVISMIFKKVFKTLPEKSVIDAYMNMYRDPAARTVLAGFMHYLPSISQLMWTIRRDLKNLTCPSMFVFGEDDILVKSQEARRLAESMPHGAFRCLPGVGHFPTEEVPAAINAEIGAHLSLLGVEC
ncbi:MAG: alpha/beta hydrolase [Pseudomonadota bacterium]|nr:alpha/beta hydrolase [Pseudomonadota bacterium]